MSMETPRLLSMTETSALEARFGFRVAACLNEQAAALPYEVMERLRIGREQALRAAQAQRTVAAKEKSAAAGNIVVLTGGESWWWRLSSLAPLVLLVVGLVLVHKSHVNEEITAVADVDAALLTDAVPLAAYSDPGFAEFLKEPVVSKQD